MCYIHMKYCKMYISLSILISYSCIIGFDKQCSEDGKYGTLFSSYIGCKLYTNIHYWCRNMQWRAQQVWL